MAAPAPVVRVRGFQIDGRGFGHLDRLTAESEPRTLIRADTHAVIRPHAAVSRPAEGDGYAWLDLLSTTDPAITPADRRWRLTLWAGNRELGQWFLDIDHAAAPLVRFGEDGREDPDGPLELPALWFTDLEDMTAPPAQVPAGSLADYFTRAQVRAQVGALEQRMDGLEATGGLAGARRLEQLEDVTVDAAQPGDVLATVDGETWAPAPTAYTHVQALPSKAWLILHPLARTPSDVVVEGPDGRRLYPRRVTFPQPGQCRIDFPTLQTGRAHL